MIGEGGWARGEGQKRRDVGLPRGGQAPPFRPFEALPSTLPLEALAEDRSLGSLLGGGEGRAQPHPPPGGVPCTQAETLNWRQWPWQLLYSEELTLIQ